TFSKPDAYVHAGLERVPASTVAKRVRVLEQRRVVALLGATGRTGKTDRGQRTTSGSGAGDRCRVVDDRNSIPSRQHERKRYFPILFIGDFPGRPHIMPVCPVTVA